MTPLSRDDLVDLLRLIREKMSLRGPPGLVGLLGASSPCDSMSAWSPPTAVSGPVAALLSHPKRGSPPLEAPPLASPGGCCRIARSPSALLESGVTVRLSLEPDSASWSSLADLQLCITRSPCRSVLLPAEGLPGIWAATEQAEARLPGTTLPLVPGPAVEPFPLGGTAAGRRLLWPAMSSCELLVLPPPAAAALPRSGAPREALLDEALMSGMWRG
mmetsp:Transcript_5952/g.16658  ORF Transcript_5952/g.16658 Transcript_5952/m.16658 type:complete len:217 (+) Transcript_5952:110-760(+)